MKRVKETLAVLFLSLVLGSCGSLMDNNILLSIHKGMTQEEVTKLLGRPDYRRFDEQGEQWEYRKGGGIGHYGTTILIDFKNNLVSNLDSLRVSPLLLRWQYVLPHRWNLRLLLLVRHITTDTVLIIPK